MNKEELKNYLKNINPLTDASSIHYLTVRNIIPRLNMNNEEDVEIYKLAREKGLTI